jgi:hypothetical protein
MAVGKKKSSTAKCLIFKVVPGAGLEPARLAAGDFESPESTNFTTRAGIREDRDYCTFLQRIAAPLAKNQNFMPILSVAPWV